MLRRVVLLVGLAAIATGCSKPTPVEDLSVVLVTLDTTRADRIGAFGGMAVSTPHLDRIAKEGVSFDQAISQVPLTLPAHGTMFTSKYPATHGVRHNGLFRLRDEETTLAERLRENGFATAAFVGAFVLNRGYGAEQGFETYDDVSEPESVDAARAPLEAQRTADDVNAAVFRWLDGRPQGRFFLWVHYYDPHAPYSPPEKAGRTLSGTGYDREISYVDHCFGDLVARLERDGLLDDAVLAVIGDHGESLGAHGEQTHGIFLYEPALRVPFFLRAKGHLPRGKRVDAPVELTDLAPTLLDLLGIEPLPGSQGISLLPSIRGTEDRSGRAVFAETLMPRIEFGWSELRMIRDRRFKYVKAPRPELYDLRDDPGETINLIASSPDRAGEMAAELEAWVARTTSAEAETGARRGVSAEEAAQLRSLGYLGGTSGIDEDGGNRPDPKDRIAEGERVSKARSLIEQGKPAEALPILDPIVRESPGNHLARASRAQALLRVGRIGEAEDEAFSALAAATADADASEVLVRKARRLLATVLWMTGKRREAREQYGRAMTAAGDEESTGSLPGILLGAASSRADAEWIVANAMERDPADPAAWSARFFLESRHGSEEGALAAAVRLAEIGDGEPAALAQAGRLAQSSGRVPLAVRLFELADRALPGDPDILGYLGSARLNAGDLAGAERAFEAVRRGRPEDPRAPFFLANIALVRGDEAAAKRMIDEALRRDPGFVPPLLNYAGWLAERGRTEEAIRIAEDALARRPGDENARALLRRLRGDAAAGRG